VGPGGTHGCAGCLVFRPRPLSGLDLFGGRYPVAARGGQMLEGKQAGVRPLVLARFSTWQLGLFFCFDTGKPPKDAKGWPHFSCGARTMGCGRWPGRLSFGTGLRKYATRPSHSSSAWHRVASGVAAAACGSGEDWSAHPPRGIPTRAIMESTRKRFITGPSHPHSPGCVEGKGSHTSRRNPPRSVPPPTPVPTGGHPCPGARLAP
jgi:hypothetical protein